MTLTPQSTIWIVIALLALLSAFLPGRSLTYRVGVIVGAGGYLALLAAFALFLRVAAV